MHEHLDALEQRMQQLQQAMRRAQLARDNGQVKQLRDDLRRAQRAWDALFEQAEDTEETAAREETSRGTPAHSTPAEPVTPLPAREQVHQVLTLLAVPAAPKLISTVHEAFFAGALAPSRLTSLRRDEERSYRSAPGARPYYLCPALTSDLLSPARGLLTVSTWPLEQRIVGPLSARVHFLTSALNIADAAERLDTDTLPLAARQLLTRYAQNIPGAQPPIQQRTTVGPPIDLPLLRRAAQDELALHTDTDTTTRTEAAQRARYQLDDAGLLFGGSFQSARRLRSVP
ncbi:hypothetical protein [Streptomyces sp. NBC_00525]|uniref:hypothetical protein n=1 Tax=Streptomyces sp. NBC_00525 TaxID=2903660 RepID=UPI002E80F4D2|nr:hypothetical protein [Streptomyces sp. NBC_00525]WUC92108.1 hypothetical protein OG710_00090 [Streptomyces sp. NBC_00525]WUC97537.1 hypothetical protein OG710_29705 [Streptomyces sp. NBC_00525]